MSSEITTNMLIARATGWVVAYDNDPADESEKAARYGVGTRQLISDLTTLVGVVISREPATPEAFAVLKKALQTDDDYAWSWQCNIAMAFYDELGPLVNPSALRHEVCNRAAARFMKLCFDVDTSKPPESGADMRGAQPTAAIADKAEPDMTRMGDKYIKPCRGCDALILWAKHENTMKVAPLVKAKDGETPNIIAWFDESNGRWLYKIKGKQSEVRGIPEYVNHFSNCVRSKDFRSAAVSEDEARQAEIK